MSRLPAVPAGPARRVRLALAGGLLSPFVVASAGQDAPPDAPLGRFVREVRGLASPTDLAFAPDGTLWVLETDRHRAVALGPGGAPRASSGGPGEGPGELLFPEGLALAPDGSVWIADTGHDRVVAFAPDGALVASFGARGAEPGELRAPCGIAVRAVAPHDGDAHGGDAVELLVAVCDRGNDRVQVFDARGRLRSVVGVGTETAAAESTPSGRAGTLRRPQDVAFGPDGSLYVADQGHDRVQHFAADGSFLDAWGGFGGYEGQLDGPSGVAVGPIGASGAGGVHVVDHGNHRVQLFDAGGRWIRSWGVHALLPREGAGKLHYPARLALAPDGRTCAVAETFEDRVQLFERWRAGEDPPVPLLAPKEGGSTHYGRALDAALDLYVVSAPETHALLVLDSTPAGAPVLVTTFGGHGTGWGRFVRPSGVDVAVTRAAPGDPGDPGEPREHADGEPLDGERIVGERVDGDGWDEHGGARERWSVLVADLGNRRLQEIALARSSADPLGFRPEMGRFARGLDLAALGRDFAGTALEWTPEPGALRRAADGTVFVCDTANDRVLVLSPDLEPRAVIGAHGTGAGELRAPRDVALGPDGLVWVVDAHNFRVQAFERDGRPRRALGRRGDGPGELLAPSGILVEPDGSVLVSDARRHDVQVFGPDGTLRRTFGGPGLGAGELFRPAGLVRDAEGRLVLLDHGNHRAQRFAAERFLDAFGSRWFVEPTRR